MNKSNNYFTVTELMQRWHCSRPTALRHLRRYKAQLMQFGTGGKVLVSEDEVAKVEVLVAAKEELQA